VRGQVCEVGDRHAFASDATGELTHFLMRALQELVDQSELIDNFECRRMNGVSAAVAGKVGVLSNTETRTPARARSNPSIMPARPPPATTHRGCMEVSVSRLLRSDELAAPLT
jgi:hypothetical protein